VIVSDLAAALHIFFAESAPTIFFLGSGYTVIGILVDVNRDPEALSSAYIFSGLASQTFGTPTSDQPTRMVIHTRIGAASQVASEAAVALRPDQPTSFQVTPPESPSLEQGAVTTSRRGLFVSLSLVVAVIAVLWITNTTFVSVLERHAEFVLRRALGVRASSVFLQIVMEAGGIDVLAGLIGATLGITVVLAAAIANQWTAILGPAVTMIAPVVSLVTSVIAALWSAYRGARQEPATILRAE